MKRISALLVVLCLLSSPAAFAGGRKLGEMPAPRLMLPSDETDLAGKKELEFRWGPDSGANFDHYDFRLYKGTETYEKGLILKKEVPKDVHSVSLDVSQFEAGQTYAWSLRYVGNSKSRSSSVIFFIKK